jgi:septal ring factor EnvC (AmiA/AmiB activator)
MEKMAFEMSEIRKLVQESLTGFESTIKSVKQDIDTLHASLASTKATAELSHNNVGNLNARL